MRTTSFSFFHLLACFFVLSCNPENKIKKAGQITLQIRQFDTATAKSDTVLLFSDFHFWFYDSMIIAATPSVDLHTNEYGNTTKSTKIESYTFIDLRRRTYTLYKTFTDTATLIKTYNHPDTGRVEGGWNFISQNSNTHLATFWTDTLIEGKIFKLYKSLYTPTDKGSERLRYYFLRKGKQNWWPIYFTLDHTLTKKTGLAVTKRLDFIPNSSYCLSVEYLQLSSTLSNEQIQIFNTWKKKQL